MPDMTKRLYDQCDAISDLLAQSATPEQRSLISCLLTAVLGNLPAIILSFLNCMQTPNPPPPDGTYNPGDRDRCPT